MNLAEENEHLRQQVRELKGSKLYWPVEWKITEMEHQVLRLLVTRDMCSLDTIMATLYGHRTEPPEPNIVRIFIGNLRRKLAERGFEIKTRWGVGYQVSAEHRRQLKEIAAS